MPTASPIIVTTLPSRFDTGISRASKKATPNATMVDAKPIKNGSDAATTVPKATSRITRVSGSARFSARSPPSALLVLMS